MTDAAFQNAEARRGVIRRELQETQARVKALTDELDRIDRFLQDWREFAGVSDPEVVDNMVEVESAAPKPRNPPREEIGDILVEVLNERGSPILRDRFFEELERRGIHLNGKDPRMILSTMIWRMDDRFVRLPKHGYWFKDRPWPQAGYFPEAAERMADVVADYHALIAAASKLEVGGADKFARDGEYQARLQQIAMLEDRYPELRGTRLPED